MELCLKGLMGLGLGERKFIVGLSIFALGKVRDRERETDTDTETEKLRKGDGGVGGANFSGRENKFYYLLYSISHMYVISFIPYDSIMMSAVLLFHFYRCVNRLAKKLSSPMSHR